MTLKTVKYLLAIMTIIILAITAGCTQETSTSSSNTSSAQVNKETSASSTTETTTKETTDKITIYFPSSNGDKLLPATRKINLNREDKYQAVVQALIDGPATDKEGIYIMPKYTQVLSVKVDKYIATVDFNKAFKTNFTGGSTGELMLIGSIVDSLTEFKDIKAVRFTVEGKPLEFLSGHLDLTEPQKRMNDLL